jgi:hypothetical protein
LSQGRTKTLGAFGVEVTELVTEKAVRPIRHQVAYYVKKRITTFIGRQIGSELVPHSGAYLPPGRVVDRHGDEPCLDAMRLQQRQQPVEIQVQDGQWAERLHGPLDGDDA